MWFKPLFLKEEFLTYKVSFDSNAYFDSLYLNLNARNRKKNNLKKKSNRKLSKFFTRLMIWIITRNFPFSLDPWIFRTLLVNDLYKFLFFEALHSICPFTFTHCTRSLFYSHKVISRRRNISLYSFCPHFGTQKQQQSENIWTIA